MTAANPAASTPPLIEMLGRLVEADRAAGQPETFVLVYAGGRHQIIGHPVWREESDGPSDIDVDEMADHGWVRITDIDGKRRNFAVTSPGREAWDEHVDLLRPEAATTRVTLDWSSARPVLRHVFDAYQDRGAPRRGVDVFAIGERPGDRAPSRRMSASSLALGTSMSSLEPPRSPASSNPAQRRCGCLPAGPRAQRRTHSRD